MATTLEVKIYCGTYAKYNDGSIQGAWIDVTELSKEEFFEKCKELHSDEEDPEFMFQDNDTESKLLRDMISESGIDTEFWDLKETMLELSDSELEAFEVYVSNGHNADIRQFKDDFYIYLDDYNLEEAFGQFLLEESGAISSLPQWAQMYFDYEEYGRDMLINSFWHDGGYIFHNN
jgi:antirestriction protein